MQRNLASPQILGLESELLTFIMNVIEVHEAHLRQCQLVCFHLPVCLEIKHTNTKDLYLSCAQGFLPELK